MKKIIFPFISASVILAMSAIATAQKTTSTVAASKPVTTTNNVNTLSYTMVEQSGSKKDMVLTSAAKAANEQSNYFNTARVDQAHKNDKGEKDPVLKIDISHEKDQTITASMLIPIVNDTGTVVATYQSDYDNIISWIAGFEVYRLSPQQITITITKWAAIGDFMEGTFSGTASLINNNKIYDSDNPPPTVIIKNGRFRIKRVKDQTGYGGE